MSLPDFVHSGDLIVAPACVASLRRFRVVESPGSPTRDHVRVRLRQHGREEIEGEDAVQLFEAFRRISISAGATAAGASQGGDDSLSLDSFGDNPQVVRTDIGASDEANGGE